MYSSRRAGQGDTQVGRNFYGIPSSSTVRKGSEGWSRGNLVVYIKYVRATEFLQQLSAAVIDPHVSKRIHTTLEADNVRGVAYHIPNHVSGF